MWWKLAWRGGEYWRQEQKLEALRGQRLFQRTPDGFQPDAIRTLVCVRILPHVGHEYGWHTGEPESNGNTAGVLAAPTQLNILQRLCGCKLHC